MHIDYNTRCVNVNAFSLTIYMCIITCHVMCVCNVVIIILLFLLLCNSPPLACREVVYYYSPQEVYAYTTLHSTAGRRELEN